MISTDDPTCPPATIKRKSGSIRGPERPTPPSPLHTGAPRRDAPTGGHPRSLPITHTPNPTSRQVLVGRFGWAGVTAQPHPGRVHDLHRLAVLHVRMRFRMLRAQRAGRFPFDLAFLAKVAGGLVAFRTGGFRGKVPRHQCDRPLAEWYRLAA